MALGGPAQVLELVQAKRPMLAIDEDEIEVELPQDVDHPWGWEGKVVAVRLASRTHGGYDTVVLLHRMSSCVWRLRSDRPILPVSGPLPAAELCTARSESSKMRCKAANGQRPLCAGSGHNIAGRPEDLMAKCREPSPAASRTSDRPRAALSRAVCSGSKNA